MLLGDLAGGQHHPHRARRVQALDEVRQRGGTDGALGHGLHHRVAVGVVHHHLMLGVAEDAVRHATPHPAHADEPDLAQDDSSSGGVGCRRTRSKGIHCPDPTRGGLPHARWYERGEHLSPDPTHQRPDRNLALELVRVTEAAALAAARLVGKGDKEAADQAAVDGMHYALQSVQMDGLVVIGEGEKDEAPMLANGEHIGDGSPPEVDIAVDPLEGTTLAAHGMPSALAVIALSSRGTMFDPGPCVYMEKMVGSPEIADLLDLDRPLPETVALIAERKGCEIGDVDVVVLDRPRHEQGIKAIREAGARVRLIAHGDVSASLLAVTERSPVDLLWGIGGTPEGVISAAAIKCLGGQLLGRLWPRNEHERSAALDAGYDLRADSGSRRSGGGRGRVLLRHRHHRRRCAAGCALPQRRRCQHRIAGDAHPLGHRAAHHRAPRPREAAGGVRRRAVWVEGGAAGRRPASRAPLLSDSQAAASRPTRDFARSRRASERRKPCVTITWMRDCVAL